MVVLHRKIQELKNRTTPISYSHVSVDNSGQLSERVSLLDKRIVEGYGCIWGQRNEHGEVFTRGAFAKSIADYGPGSNANYQIKFRDEHGKACSLFEELKEDDIGLYFRTKPLDMVPWCDDLLIQLRSGTINNFSNGFKHIWQADKIKYDEKTDTFTILEARLFEISAVSIPSDMETFAKRSHKDEETITTDVEEFIADLPRSKQFDARKLFTRCMTLEPLEPLEHRKQALDNEPSKKGIDIKYLISKL